MEASVYFEIAVGMVGGIAGEVAHYFSQKRSGLPFHPFTRQKMATVALFSGLWTAAYFSFDGTAPTTILLFNYGVFISLLAEDILDLGNFIKTPTVASLAIVPAVIILNGYPEVFLVGAFGAFLGEFLPFYIKRKRKGIFKLPEYHRILSGIMILAGGALTVLHGVTDVSALLAVQIGASAPMIIERFKK
jgi:hypothetical protein